MLSFLFKVKVSGLYYIPAIAATIGLIMYNYILILYCWKIIEKDESC